MEKEYSNIFLKKIKENFSDIYEGWRPSEKNKVCNNGE